MPDVSDVKQAEFVKLLGSDKNGIETVPVGNTPYWDQVRNWGEVNFTQELTDAFGRLRSSSPASIFDSSFRYDLEPTKFNSSTTNATVVRDANFMSAVLSTTSTASVAIARFQSYRNFPYNAGKSQVVIFSANFRAGATSCEKRIGQFNDNNGYFFSQKGSLLYAGIRSAVSGAPVTTEVVQSDWNIDKLDGTGRSGITLDYTKQNIYLIDYQWLGSGRIRFGLVLNGAIVYCHQINNSNVITTPYSQSATLPFRASIENNGIASGLASLSLTCISIYSEGDYGPENTVRAASNGVTLVSVGSALAPVLALRKNASFLDAVVQLIEIGLFVSSSDDVLWKVLWNPTLTGGAWVAEQGFCELNRTATAVSGGTLIANGYVRGGGSVESLTGSQLLLNSVNTWLGTSLAGASDILCIATETITGSTNLAASMIYRELT